jgi:hypothetical protein
LGDKTRLMLGSSLRHRDIVRNTLYHFMHCLLYCITVFSAVEATRLVLAPEHLLAVVTIAKDLVTKPLSWCGQHEAAYVPQTCADRIDHRCDWALW